MATRRLRIDSNGTYYHLITRAAGCASERPFGHVEKRKLVELITDLDRFHTIEIIAYSVMSTHLHLVVMAPEKLTDHQETARRFKAYYPNKQLPVQGTEHYERLRERMRDISDFMKSLQMRFTCWFNRTRPEKRCGRLWSERFKSVILQGGGSSAVWSCVKYVELNAVRAGLVEDPGAYRFCSWGVYCGTGKHPFSENFLRHSRWVLGDSVASLSDGQMFLEFRAGMVRTLAVASQLSLEDVDELMAAARRGAPLWDVAERRVRFWTDGAVIGSRAFVKECYARLLDATRAMKHQCGTGRTATGEKLYALRRLQVDVE